jgi:hypothetical protein
MYYCYTKWSPTTAADDIEVGAAEITKWISKTAKILKRSSAIGFQASDWSKKSAKDAKVLKSASPICPKNSKLLTGPNGQHGGPRFLRSPTDSARVATAGGRYELRQLSQLRSHARGAGEFHPSLREHDRTLLDRKIRAG